MKKELIKPNSIKNKIAKEVESLCDGFTCGSYSSWPSTDTQSGSEILF